MCEESASFDLTSTDISLCIGDVDTILKAKKEEQEFSTEGAYCKMSVCCMSCHTLYTTLIMILSAINNEIILWSNSSSAHTKLVD